MTTARKPQDRKPKTTEPEKAAPLIINVRGRDWTIDAELMSDMEFFEDIDAVNSGNLIKLPSFCRRFLGIEQYEAAKELVRDATTGRVPPQALLELVGELIGADSSAGVSLGESAAS